MRFTELTMLIREAKEQDIDAIFKVRIAVRENILTYEQLAERGITPDSVLKMLQTDCKAWVVTDEDAVVGFSLADRTEREILALFVLPEYEGRGLGSQLLDKAMEWLLNVGRETIWLRTGPGTDAYAFYIKRGWREVGPAPHDNVVLEYQQQAK
ncbi:MAG: GNAT family N-acetyltransferase [Gammaproteobacteria bacterium]|nr:GNAT family N-acetyltransferase [Gammaproteobacteria bacterium]